MNLKQKLLRRIYPVLLKINRIMHKNDTHLSSAKKALSSIYDLSVTLNDGTQLPLQNLKGKKFVLVNTASACGYTAQYAALQELYAAHQDSIQLIGFPSNDFGAQEQGSDAEIASFCEVNFGVRFPLAQKSPVKKGADQNPVYQWLTDPALNGWNDMAPTWNFCKYIIDEEGNLVHFFEAGVAPADEAFVAALDI